MRWQACGNRHSPIFPNTIREILNSLPDALSEDKRYDIKVCLNEAFNNAFQYGGRTIYLDVFMNNLQIIIKVSDSGRGFDTSKIEEAKFPEPEKEAGRGFWLMKKLMNRVEYSRLGNKITLVKYFHLPTYEREPSKP